MCDRTKNENRQRLVRKAERLSEDICKRPHFSHLHALCRTFLEWDFNQLSQTLFLPTCEEHLAHELGPGPGSSA